MSGRCPTYTTSGYCIKCRNGMNSAEHITRYEPPAQISRDYTIPLQPLAQETQNIFGHRAYKCPKCGGEFDLWHHPIEKTVQTEFGPTSVKSAVGQCPFCGLRQSTGPRDGERETQPREESKEEGTVVW